MDDAYLARKTQPIIVGDTTLFLLHENSFMG